MTAQSSMQAEVERLVRQHGRGREALMPILQDINRAHNYVSEEAMLLLAEALDVPRSDIYGVVTFYSFLSARPRGRYVVRVCQTISCSMKDESQTLRAALLDELGIGFGETTSDNIFTLEHINCIGMCDQGPAMLVGENVHVRLTAELIRVILKGYRAEAREGGLRTGT